MENRAHFETLAARINRFNQHHDEAILTLMESVANFFNNEIKRTVLPENAQTSLMFLGIHAVALTFSSVFYEQEGLVGYKKYLEQFLDGSVEDTKFSLIADKIHGWRNVLAHQWLGAVGHSFGYDYSMAKGWENREGAVYINPGIYCDCYLNGFKKMRATYRKILSEAERRAISNRIIDKYLRH